MRDETKDDIYVFKVRDYTTEIVGRYNKDEGYYYVERGDGTCYKYYPPVEYSCRIMTSRKKGILGSIKHFAQSFSDRSGSIPSDKFKYLASKVFEHVSPSLDTNSLERLSPRLNKYGGCIRSLWIGTMLVITYRSRSWKVSYLILLG